MRSRFAAFVHIIVFGLISATLVAGLGAAGLVGAAPASAGPHGRRGAAVVQQALLGAAAGDYFGHYTTCPVAISGDTAVVSSFYDAGGSAYIYVRDAGSWSLQQVLTAPAGVEGDSFGSSVAISGDTVVVGASGHSVGVNPRQGAAYVFLRSDGVWSRQAQLIAADGAEDDAFGSAVAVAGGTVVVAADADDIDGNENQGSAYVFVRDEATWSQQAKLTAADGSSYDWFGFSVAISGSANTVSVGAPLATDPDASFGEQGAVYVFARAGLEWTPQAELNDADGATWDCFGSSVALTDDTLVVGSYNDVVGANEGQGSAVVFTRGSSGWRQRDRLTAADGAAHMRFGHSVAISGDTVLVGAYNEDMTFEYSGAAYVFTGTGVSWKRQAPLPNPDSAPYDAFGSCVAISGDTAVVGGYVNDGDPVGDQGSARVFLVTQR